MYKKDKERIFFQNNFFCLITKNKTKNKTDNKNNKQHHWLLLLLVVVSSRNCLNTSINARGNISKFCITK